MTFSWIWIYHNILFDVSEYFINYNLNYEFGTNKCLCHFDVLQKTADSSLKMK